MTSPFSYFRSRIERALSPKRGGKRRKPSARLRTRVRGFFGRECVVCQEFAGVDLHHLNEDRTDTCFANLLPVCAGLNQAVQRHREGEPLRGHIDPLYLREIARSAFDRGDYPRSYACNRVAAYFFHKYADSWTQAAESLVFALADLRPTGEPELLLDTVGAFLALQSLHKKRPQAYFWSAEFTSQLAMVLYDFMAVHDAVSMADLSIELAKRAQRETPEHPARFRERVARMIKRFVLAHAPSVRSLTDRKTAGLVSRIQESKAGSRLNRQATRSAEFTEATLYRALGRTSRALDVLEPAIEELEGADFWTRVGLYIEAAICYVQKRDFRAAEVVFERALEIANAHRIVPIPVPGQAGLRQPAEVLHVLPTPFPRVRVRPPNPLSAAMLEVIVSHLPRA